MLENFLTHQTATVVSVARSRGLPTSTVQDHMTALLDRFLESTPWPAVPETGPLIMVADARVKYTEGGWYTGYFFFVRRTQDTQAVILPPYWHPGVEKSNIWRLAFETLPRKLMSRIVALTCDGHTGLVNEAKWQGWLLQRCHAHLIMRIQGRRSRWYSSRHRAEGEELYKLTKQILTEPDESKIFPAVSRIEEIGWQMPSKDFKKTLKGFVNHFRDFRTYLIHPELNIPTTNNTAEAFNGCVQELVHRARGFRSRRSLENWIAAIIKFKKTIKCSGKHQPS